MSYLAHRIAKQENEIAIAKDAFVSVRVHFLKRELDGEGLSDAELAKIAEEEEWPVMLKKDAPDCHVCEFISPPIPDYYGTGDSPTKRECLAGCCPWGKD